MSLNAYDGPGRKRKAIARRPSARTFSRQSTMEPDSLSGQCVQLFFCFDVDGTLVTTGGAGRRALERVFAHCFGREDACSFRLDGMTDRAIVRAGLTSIGIAATEQEIDAVLSDYLRILEEEWPRWMPASTGCTGGSRRRSMRPAGGLRSLWV